MNKQRIFETLANLCIPSFSLKGSGAEKSLLLQLPFYYDYY